MSSLPHIHGVSHRFIKANGVKLHVAEAGKGPPLLMLHGWPQHWYMWRHQIPGLSAKFRVVCPDLRGFGWSEAPAKGYEKETLVDDILALMDALKIGEAGLIGHDWGGWVGFLLCLRKPERFRRYLALNIPHPFQRIDSRLLTLWRFWYQALIASPLLGPLVLKDKTRFVRNMLRVAMAGVKLTDEEAAVYSKKFDEPRRALASQQLYRTFLLKEFLPVITGRYSSQTLRVPTLMLFGRDDFAISTKLLQGYESHALDLRLEYVADCGHFIAEERPNIVTQKALEFFS